MRLFSRPGIAFLVLSCPALAAGQNPVQPGQTAGRLKSFAALPADIATSAAGESVRTSIAAPGEDRHAAFMNRLWIASLFATGAATGFDAATSWGKREGNPVLASSNDAFGVKGIGLKAAIAAAALIPQICLRKRKELKGVFAAGNFVEAGIFSGVAVHNLRTQ